MYDLFFTFLGLVLFDRERNVYLSVKTRCKCLQSDQALTDLELLFCDFSS